MVYIIPKEMGAGEGREGEGVASLIPHLQCLVPSNCAKKLNYGTIKLVMAMAYDYFYHY